MKNTKTIINGIIALLLLFAASNAALAYYAGSAQQQPQHQMTYEEVMKATEKDCCK